MSYESGAPLVIIPARLAAKRLPNKPLAVIGEAPLIWHVVERVTSCPEIDRCVVATDHPSIVEEVQRRGGEVLLVDDECDCGSQRVARAVDRLMCLEGAPQGWNGRWVLNVQGDEPFLPTDSLSALIQALNQCDQDQVKIATLAAPIPVSSKHKSDPSCVKVCIDQNKNALYFSRRPIGFHQHIGVYAFHVDILPLTYLPRSMLALQEDLEQLTWLESGEKIRVVLVNSAHARSIDTPRDLAWAREEWYKRNL